jgi:hypothetical protein
MMRNGIIDLPVDIKGNIVFREYQATGYNSEPGVIDEGVAYEGRTFRKNCFAIHFSY